MAQAAGDQRGVGGIQTLCLRFIVLETGREREGAMAEENLENMDNV